LLKTITVTVVITILCIIQHGTGNPFVSRREAGIKFKYCFQLNIIFGLYQILFPVPAFGTDRKLTLSDVLYIHFYLLLTAFLTDDILHSAFGNILPFVSIQEIRTIKRRNNYG